MIWWLGGAILLILLLVLGNSLRNALGLSAQRMRVSELSDLLSPAYDIRLPDGAAARLPTALLFSGCDGVRDNMARWAEALNDAGWAAVIVDSHGPRGYDDLQVWRLVCAGQLLSGAERASDVAVALADARAMDFVDPDLIALIGASHGGWAVQDFLALHGKRRRPPLLKRWPAGMNGDGPPPGVIAALTLYPYCGTLSLAARWGWVADVPVLMLLVEGDTITGEDACIDLAARMQARGRPVATYIYQGVTHGFDQAEKAPLSTLGHDPEATTDALARGLAFLQAAAGRSD